MKVGKLFRKWQYVDKILCGMCLEVLRMTWKNVSSFNLTLYDILERELRVERNFKRSESKYIIRYHKCIQSAKVDNFIK